MKRVINCDKKARKLYKERTGSFVGTDWQNARTIEEKLKRIKEAIYKAMVFKEIKMKRRKVQ